MRNALSLSLKNTLGVSCGLKMIRGIILAANALALQRQSPCRVEAGILSI